MTVDIAMLGLLIILIGLLYHRHICVGPPNWQPIAIQLAI
jgi:hypothetical protein